MSNEKLKPYETLGINEEKLISIFLAIGYNYQQLPKNENKLSFIRPIEWQEDYPRFHIVLYIFNTHPPSFHVDDRNHKTTYTPGDAKKTELERLNEEFKKVQGCKEKVFLTTQLVQCHLFELSSNIRFGADNRGRTIESKLFKPKKHNHGLKKIQKGLGKEKEVRTYLENADDYWVSEDAVSVQE